MKKLFKKDQEDSGIWDQGGERKQREGKQEERKGEILCWDVRQISVAKSGLDEIVEQMRQWFLNKMKNSSCTQEQHGGRLDGMTFSRLGGKETS